MESEDEVLNKWEGEWEGEYSNFLLIIQNKGYNSFWWNVFHKIHGKDFWIK